MLETKINVISDCEKELEVSLTYEEILPEIEKAYNEEKKKIEMPGFRKGKVPMSLIQKTYGAAIEHGACEDIAQNKFWEVSDAQDLRPISRPSITDIKFEKNEKLTFKVRYEVKPVLELKDYTNQEVKKFIFSVDDAIVDKEVESILLANKKIEDAELVDDKYSIVNVDINKLDEEGNVLQENMSKALDIALYEERVNEQIISNAIGKKTGETFRFTFHDEREVEEGEEKKTVHEDYHYEAIINSIKKVVLPELDEELVKKVSRNKFATADELKDDIKKGLTDYYTQQSESMFENTLLDMVVKNNDFEPPHGYVHFLLDRMVSYEEEKTKREGNGKFFDRKEAHNRLHNNAVWSAKWQVVMENIAAKENISVSDEEIKELAEKEAEKNGITVDKLLKYYADTNKKETYLEDKVIDFLKKNNNIKEINPNDVKDNNNQEA